MPEKVIPALEARTHMGEIMRRSVLKKERFIVKKSGIPMVAIINMSDYEEFRQFEESRKRDFRRLEEIRAKLPDLSEEQIDKLVDEAVRSVRRK